jgi:DNA-binding response OmpR family regulator
MKTILVVDDERKIVDLARDYLEHAGFVVRTAGDGPAALELLARDRPDLVVLDLGLPGLDGLDVTRRIRRDSNLPVIMLTARDDELDKLLGLELGADDYLTKPFAFAELLVRVKALLRRGPVNRASVIRVGDLELDRLSRRVTRGGRLIEVTAKEYALLEYLMSNAGRVLSRSMIIEHVWDQSFDGVFSIVDVYLGRLRSKIDQSADHKLIRTVRGVGYSISHGAPS